VIDGQTSAEDLQKILLTNRQISPDDYQEFIKPSFPELGIDFSIASRLVNDAIKRRKQILIYGDYDVDGITATAILWQSLYKLYPHITPFIPSRDKDGYGIKAESVFRFQQEKGIVFDLIITVDNGIVAGAEFSQIKNKQDCRLIVIDHHLPDRPLTDIDALIHTTSLSGAALAWFFAREFDPTADMGLAALGTVADCLPLTGTNRSLVVHGLQSLRLNPSPGIKKLIEVSGIKKDSISAYDLGFVLGPRINAVGRLSDPTDALRLLCSKNIIQASKYAQILNSYNKDRQILQKDSLEVAANLINTKKKLLFVSDPSFNPGIIGLIAGRLTEKYYLPSIVVSSDGAISRGSCRSIPELNIVDMLRRHSDLFIDLGGHAAAAGFSIETQNIAKLKKALMADISHKLKGIKLEPKIIVDAQMKLSALSLKNIIVINELSPFGIGNPEPLFLFSKLKIVSKRLLGQQGDHLKLKLDDPDTPKVEYLAADAIAFKKGELDHSLNVGDLIDIVASLNANTWNNTTTPQLIVKEIII
jgi:single-stranded-DNA-specific exonuclease